MANSLPPTERFRRQHDELNAMGKEILDRLAQGAVAADAAELRKLVARFAGKLSVHATMENEALYPRLLAHAEPAVRDQARALLDDVGPLYATFAEYAKRWPSAQAIELDPRGFTGETRNLLRALAHRMMREDRELYPLVDVADT